MDVLRVSVARVKAQIFFKAGFSSWKVLEALRYLQRRGFGIISG